MSTTVIEIAKAPARLSADLNTNKLTLISLKEKISIVEYEGICFVICDSPTDRTIDNYLKEFKRLNVKHVVRLCEPTYSADLLEGIKVHEMPFKDGEGPPADVVKRWLAVVDECAAIPEKERPAIAVHCVAGLGRAPMLVSIALTELGMPSLDAAEYVRKRRPGALNSKQILYLEAYKKRTKTMENFRKGFLKLFRSS